MKKLNITKKQYDESKYFTKKYGSIKFVSESGKMYKTDKGVVLTLEASPADLPPPPEKAKNDIKLESEGDEGDNGDNGSEVTRGELTDMLTDVVKEVEKVCNDQDCSFDEVCGVEPEGEADEGADADEVVATKDEVAEVLSGVIAKVEEIADKNGIELPKSEDDEDDDGDGDGDEGDDSDNEIEIGDDNVIDEDDEKKSVCKDEKCECGGKCRHSFKESAKRAKRASLVREAIAKRAKLRKVRESLRRRAKARKVLESIRHRRALKKIMESRKARKAKVMESSKVRPMHFKRIAAK